MNLVFDIFRTCFIVHIPHESKVKSLSFYFELNSGRFAIYDKYISTVINELKLNLKLLFKVRKNMFKHLIGTRACTLSKIFSLQKVVSAIVINKSMLLTCIRLRDFFLLSLASLNYVRKTDEVN